MTLPQFLNAARILHFIERDDLIAAGVIHPNDGMAWLRWSGDPIRSLIRMDDAKAAAVWGLVEWQMQPQRVV